MKFIMLGGVICDRVHSVSAAVDGVIFSVVCDDSWEISEVLFKGEEILCCMVYFEDVATSDVATLEGRSSVFDYKDEGETMALDDDENTKFDASENNVSELSCSLLQGDFIGNFWEKDRIRAERKLKARENVSCQMNIIIDVFKGDFIGFAGEKTIVNGEKDLGGQEGNTEANNFICDCLREIVIWEIYL